MDEQELRDVIARLPGPVVLAATAGAGGFRAATVTSFAFASYEPPLVLLLLDRHSTTRAAIEEAGAFSVSVLAAGQEFLADRFAGQAPAADPAWREVPHRLGEAGLPLVDGAAAWFECRLHHHQPVGDHEALVGAVTAAGRGGGEPLLRWERGYWRLGR